MVNLTHLQYFIALCETENYSAAAKRCFISRQALRQAVASLEDFFQVELIRNEHNRLIVTATGNILYEEAKKVNNVCEEMVHRVFSAQFLDRPIRIGISRSLLPVYAPDIVQRLNILYQKYPGVRVEKQFLSADMLIDLLDKDLLDCALLVDSGHPAHSFQRTEIRSNELMISMVSSHPLAHKTSLSLEDLDRQPLQLMSSPDICFFSFRDACEKKHVFPDFHTSSAFYEVCIQIFSENSLALDRETYTDEKGHYESVTLPLEGGVFRLYTVLINKEGNTAASFLRKICFT